MILSFIIVNYQSEKYLKKCISSIREKVLGVGYEIVVVNNDLEDLEAQLPKEALGDMGLINTGKNVGYGAGCNVGARMAKGEILCFLNPDTILLNENIGKLLRQFKKDSKIGLIGPKLISGENKVQWWCAGKELTPGSIILNNLGYKRDKKIWESQVPIECAWVSGAALFIRKDLFDKLDGFDEKFFMYFEDIDLCKRARMADYKVLYYPDFMIKHFGGKSFALDKIKQKKYFYKSQWRYFRKYFL